MKYNLDQYFQQGVMSVHFVTGQPLVAKQGKPGGREMVTEKTVLDAVNMQTLHAKLLDEVEHIPDAFLEIDRPYSQVLQIGPYRVVIVMPPLSKRMEITAVRPVCTMTLDAYELNKDIEKRLLQDARGILITGAPGEGKSTFATAFVNELAKKDVVIKTIESPRDLQVDETITQYSFSHAPHSEIRDILLLSRPDFSIYDEVRNQEDFLLFKDLRLTGIGLIGVMHATHAIDGVQRMLGTIEMGLIPQIIDTVVFIKAGNIQTIYTLEQTVKTPVGMTSDDLARPVVLIKDLLTQEAKYEMYNYGDSVVVMPLDDLVQQGTGTQNNLITQAAKRGLEEYFSDYLKTKVHVQIESLSRANVYVPTSVKAKFIGTKGKHIQQIEKDVGISIGVRDIKDLVEQKKANTSSGQTMLNKATGPGDTSYEINEIRKGRKHFVEINLGKHKKHEDIQCMIGEKLMTFTTDHHGIIHIRKKKLVDSIIGGDFAVI